jgi:predicted AAA+ superfamily ATPase
VLLEPWFTSFGKRVVKTPKLYFRDSGLLCFLLNLDEATLGASPYLGAIWETLVFAEMRKMNRLGARPVNVWYYRDQRAREVDFVLEQGGSLRLVECKWREHPETADALHLLAVREEIARSGSAWKPGPSWVIATPEASYSLAEGLTAGALRDLPRVLV